MYLAFDTPVICPTTQLDLNNRTTRLLRRSIHIGYGEFGVGRQDKVDHADLIGIGCVVMGMILLVYERPQVHGFWANLRNMVAQYV
jgi:hypothetical protein